MIDLGPRPRLYDLGRGELGALGRPASAMGKRKLYEDLDGGACKRRRAAPCGPPGATPGAAAGAGARLVDLQILGEDGALVQEATIEEIWAPHTTRLEIVVVDEVWEGSVSSPDTTFINLDDLGPLGGTSTLHNAILRESQQLSAAAPYAPLSAPPLPGHHPVSPAPQLAEPADSDFGNLDWLINFKVDSVFEPKKRSAGKSGSTPPRDVTSASGRHGAAQRDSRRRHSPVSGGS